MLSIRNEMPLPKFADVDVRILRAAESCVKDFGIDRVTLAEVARRARVSRPTIYRRWPDVHALLASLLTERVIGILRLESSQGLTREGIVNRSVAVVARLRHDDVVSAVLQSAPELAMRYISERLGTSQLHLISVLARDLKDAHGGGSVRAGDPHQLAAMMML
ncbi:MAG TPA: helix-turn-helix domain-containing protein, partial [Mycobacterium sp.]|nr:helix-turn-helix domain-containing protein [Mycobacterium sp.]